MLNLNDKIWKEFSVLDLFDYQRGNQNNMHSLSKGDDMLISAKNTNNGLKGFFTSYNEKQSTYKGNCITLNNDGDGGIGLAYYQPHEFLLDTHVYALYPKKNMSKYTMLYITQSLSKQRVCFSHGYSISKDRLKTMKIMLPVNEHDTPDYDFMDKYIRERENQLIQKYKEFIKNQIHAESVKSLSDVTWKEFYLISEKMFYIDSAKTFSNTSALNSSGDLDVVGATSKNNGNVGFLSDKYQSLLCRKNCICLIKTGQGSVGKAIYKNNDFIPSNNVCVIRSHWLNKYNGLFIVAEINKQADRYSYGYIRNSKRILREKLMLPADKQGNPDYDYMECYGKQIVLQKYQQYLDYINA